jgi:hypothetical protein
MIYCLQKSLIFMDSISAKSESSAWSQDPELMQRLDKIYCKYLRPHIDTDGSRNGVAKAAWRSYCYGLSRVFSSKYFPDWESVKPSFKNLQDNDCFGPMITSSYIDDLSALWTEVHPALLEVKAQNCSVFVGRSLIPVCAGYSVARTVHRLQTRLPSRDATVRRHYRTRTSRT